ncbi:MAG: DUF5615 family PIN-like protein [Betaproteobacteria bacterium]|nr:DUF5615 family PIN-like protein [Betaproteobacteria bacterium]MDH5351154.1 DUF5615 family PIN-like protein [Betaproteobacteria bacterium]
MRVLLDSYIWPGAKRDIAEAGHQVEWVGDWESDPGDADILAHAARHAQTIVTLDKDFGELGIGISFPSLPYDAGNCCRIRAAEQRVGGTIGHARARASHAIGRYGK